MSPAQTPRIKQKDKAAGEGRMWKKTCGDQLSSWSDLLRDRWGTLPWPAKTHCTPPSENVLNDKPKRIGNSGSALFLEWHACFGCSQEQKTQKYPRRDMEAICVSWPKIRLCAICTVPTAKMFGRHDACTKSHPPKQVGVSVLQGSRGQTSSSVSWPRKNKQKLSKHTRASIMILLDSKGSWRINPHLSAVSWSVWPCLSGPCHRWVYERHKDGHSSTSVSDMQQTSHIRSLDLSGVSFQVHYDIPSSRFLVSTTPNVWEVEGYFTKFRNQLDAQFAWQHLKH